MVGELVEPPVSQHLGMNEVCVDGGQLDGQPCVQRLDYLFVSFHFAYVVFQFNYRAKIARTSSNTMEGS